MEYRHNRIKMLRGQRNALLPRACEKHGFIRVTPDQLPAAFPRMALDTRFYRLAMASSQTHRQ